MRLVTTALCTLLALPAAALDLDQMTDEERALFRSEVRAYLMDNPEVIMEAVQVLEQRQADSQAQADLDLVAANAEALFNDGFSWVGGNPDGDITLVEFLDYRCGYCKRAHAEVATLLEADGEIRWIVKEFPILGEQSLLASRFAIATRLVAGDVAYAQVHDALMTFNGDISEPVLRRISDGFAFDTDAIMARMDDDAITEEIRQTRALAQRLQISGTPSFVVEDELLRGFLPADQMEIIIADKRG